MNGTRMVQYTLTLLTRPEEALNCEFEIYAVIIKIYYVFCFNAVRTR